MDPIDRLRKIVCGISGMSHENFDLSINYWQPKTYKKGEFYNEYKSVCRYLGFVLTGVFRIYKFLDQSGAEKNMQFFTNDQFMTSFKSFFSRESCEYYTEAMTESDILYIHYDHLQHLYKTSRAWERFGRIFAESVLRAVLIIRKPLCSKALKTVMLNSSAFTLISATSFPCIISPLISVSKGLP
jgi:signal-transduction protein with cAMP-binding, CBS, and nucleotidyltransferase domain